jgi:hypothetical protein
MGNRANELMHPAFGLETHPLNTIRTCVETAHKHPEMLEMLLAGMGNRCGDPEMMVSPASTQSC